MAETEAGRLVAALAEARRRAAAGEVPALHGLARAVAELPAGAITAGQLVALGRLEEGEFAPLRVFQQNTMPT